MLLIVKPGGTFQWVAVIPVAAAMSSALRDMATRRISHTETSLSIMLYSSLAVVVVGFALAPWFDWRQVTAGAWGLLVLNGLLNAGAHFLMIEAYRRGQAATIAPFKYSGLVWGILFGYLIWKHVPDLWMIGGAILVAGSGLHILRREAGAG